MYCISENCSHILYVLHLVKKDTDTTVIIFCISQILLPYQNLVPTLPMVQLDQRFGFVDTISPVLSNKTCC